MRHDRVGPCRSARTKAADWRARGPQARSSCRRRAIRDNDRTRRRQCATSGNDLCELCRTTSKRAIGFSLTTVRSNCASSHRAGSVVATTVVNGGELGEHKGMNLPGVHVSSPSLTEKDRDDLALAVTRGSGFHRPLVCAQRGRRERCESGSEERQAPTLQSSPRSKNPKPSTHSRKSSMSPTRSWWRAETSASKWLPSAFQRFRNRSSSARALTSCP